MREPTKAEIAAFRKACQTLCALGKKGFHVYLAEDSMHLMVGPSHHDATGREQQHLVRATEWVCKAGGGDW